MGRASRSGARWSSLGRSAVLAGFLALAGCGSTPSAPTPEPLVITPGPHFRVGEPYRINGKWYYPEFMIYYEAIGIASWYGAFHHGRPTANGEIFDMHALTAAHPTLQLPSVARVTNLANGRSLLVRVNDRGPFAEDRLIAVSQAAARELGFEEAGRGGGPRAISRPRALRRGADPPGRAARIRRAQLRAAGARPPGLLNRRCSGRAAGALRPWPRTTTIQRPFSRLCGVSSCAT